MRDCLANTPRGWTLSVAALLQLCCSSVAALLLQRQLADLLGPAAVFAALYLLLYFYYSISQKQLADLLGPAAVFALPLTLPAQIAAQVPYYSIFTTVYLLLACFGPPLNAASTDSCTHRCPLALSLLCVHLDVCTCIY